MRMIKLLPILLILLSGSAAAVDTNGNYAVWGMGKKSCFGFMQADADAINQYREYTKGFLTAYNIFTDKTYNISGNMDENQILEWMKEYCSENPMATIENTLVSFTFDHYDSRIRSSNRTTGR